MNVEARSKKTKKKNKHKTNRSVLILFFFMFLFAAACLSASELDDTLMHLDAGLDLALDRAKVWSKYAKDVICYVEKRTHLGNLYLIIFYLPPCNPCFPRKSFTCRGLLEVDLELEGVDIGLCCPGLGLSAPFKSFTNFSMEVPYAKY